MARKRMLDPSIWIDEGMAELEPRQQLLYIGLMSNADDDGRLKGSPAAIALMLPTIYSARDRRMVEEDLTSVLATMSKLVRYVVDGKPYLVFCNYRKWQRIDKPTASTLPPPSGDLDELCSKSLMNRSDSDSAPIVVAEDSPNATGALPLKRREVKGREVKGREIDAQSADSLDHRFISFWAAYPTKVSKQAAVKAFGKLNWQKVDFDSVMAALERQKVSDQWTREGGKYIPYPATWLNGAKWEDELRPATSGHSLISEPNGYSLDPEEAARQQRRQLEEMQRKALGGNEGQIIEMRRGA